MDKEQTYEHSCRGRKERVRYMQLYLNNIGSEEEGSERNCNELQTILPKEQTPN